MKYWALFQESDTISSFLNSCSQGMEEILVRHLDILTEKGNETRRPISAPLGGGLHELRGWADGRQARLIYFFEIGKRIIFVHACYKAGKRIHPDDMKIAIRNKKRIEQGRSVNAFTYTN